MSTVDPFYQRPPEEQVADLAQLARLALPAFGLPAEASLELVTERENAVFRCETGPGADDRYAIRVHRAGYHTDDDLRAHAAWARALTADGVVGTAPVVETTDGTVFVRVRHPAVPEERQVTALRWVEGTLLAHSGRPGAEQYREVGALMAALHHHAGQWVPPEGFSVLAWDVEGMLGEHPTWGRFWDASVLDDEGRALLGRFRSHARERLTAFGDGPDRFGLVHGDFLPENLLVGPDGAITLLDFDDGGRGWFLFDIATALIIPAMDEDYPAILDAFVSGYRSVRPLADEHLDELPFFLALRAATYVGWMDTRSHTQFARDMTPLVVDGALEAVAELLGA